MARIVRREIRKRGFFGVIFLWLFWGFNALMLWWLMSYWSTLAQMDDPGSEAARTGAAIGGTLGSGMLIGIWSSGAIILGIIVLLTRGAKTIVEDSDDEPQAPPMKEISAKAVARTSEPRPAPAPLRLPPLRPKTPPALANDKGWFIEVVGESNYQDALQFAAEHVREIADQFVVAVILEPEDSNPHDSNAVRVTFQGDTLGYLPRASAKQYRAALGATPASCTAALYGGGEDEDGEPMSYGIWLNALWPPRFR